MKIDSKKMSLALLIFYLAALTFIIVFKMQFSLEELGHYRSINLIPFGASVMTNGRLNYEEIIQNIFAFIPYGILLSSVWEKKHFLWKALPICATSLIYETLQYLLAIGASDITDLLMNTIGGLVGIGIFSDLSDMFPRYYRKVINIAACICAVALTALVVLLLVVNR